ncbi:MAG: carboxymuconolactone decarboxylase [Amycolatopsis sp.]|jgi:4-carboxymuconolactone decarboxylase|uniref:carboxymuconolactone decarboxylase family protein n=1 Tax=Amycolatopsis sp. TaxID=37632 RepID=UPI0026390AD4|nr:carboxymuconolactone decarboxylase family protein [Amycolatopsis sp.]MCU1683811.1 carboxymuconolactone decarboxylase [Amycolatopsis sp.]
MSEPRIPPLPADQLETEHSDLLDTISRDTTGASNVITTFLRHPQLLRQWMPLSGGLLYGSLLPHRDRELLILRTASTCHADYEWAHHVVIGKQAGLTDEEIKRVRNGPADDSWSNDDAVLLTAADELHHNSHISDTTWAALAARYNEKQLIEVPILVGQYHMVAFALNSFGVELEPGF